ESRRGRADRGEDHQTASGTVRGLALHQQGIFAQPGSAARSGGAAVQHRRAARPRIPQAAHRRADIRRSELRPRGGTAAETTGSPAGRLDCALWDEGREKPMGEMRMPPVAPAVGRAARPNIDPAEWEQRVNLAACYRLVEHFGWTDLIYTHISARV